MGAIRSNAQTKKNSMEQEIKKVIQNVEKASAERNVTELESLLHPEYRVIANRFKGTPGSTIIPRSMYLDMMKAEKIGGTSYQVEFKSISISDHTSMVELLYKTKESSGMHKYLLLVQDEKDQWKVVSDMPIILD